MYVGPTENRLQAALWTKAMGWGASFPLPALSWGTPALFTLQSQISVLFAANNNGRSILEMTSTGVSPGIPWNRTTSPDESTAFGVSAAASGSTVVAGFQSNNGKGQVFATFFVLASGKWLDHEDVGQTTSHTPRWPFLMGSSIAYLHRTTQAPSSCGRSGRFRNSSPQSWPFRRLRPPRPLLRF
ncbi:hypothetical protein B0H19DRAFT_1268143 [Mycena capillaripes]|nr:hypothetical protein B0H19DRAFT_1268143 [Mycena capillaripes]